MVVGAVVLVVVVVVVVVVGGIDAHQLGSTVMTSGSGAPSGLTFAPLMNTAGDGRVARRARRERRWRCGGGGSFIGRQAARTSAGSTKQKEN